MYQTNQLGGEVLTTAKAFHVYGSNYPQSLIPFCHLFKTGKGKQDGLFGYWLRNVIHSTSPGFRHSRMCVVGRFILQTTNQSESEFKTTWLGDG